MKYWRLIIPVTILIFSLFIYFAVYRVGKQTRQINNLQETSQKWESQISEETPVLIKVTPIQLGKDADPWKFSIEFTTHSGTLDQDPAKVAVLSDGAGQVYHSIMWQGAEPGGHHVSGTLVFKPISPLPKSVELKIKDVGGVPERSFKWNLK